MPIKYGCNTPTDEIIKTSYTYLCSHDRAKQEGLYFPRRRVRIDDPSKAKLLNRIENQDFKGASEQEIFLIVTKKNGKTDKNF